MNIGNVINGVNGQFDYLNGTSDSSVNRKSQIKADKNDKSVDNKNNVSKINEDKLSDKAAKFLDNLRKKYGDFDFFIGNKSEDIEALSKCGNKEFSVILSNEEIERMASDEKYAKEKMDGVFGAVDMCKKICEQEGYVSAFTDNKDAKGIVNKIGIVTDDNGNAKFFAEIEKLNDKQKERIEKKKHDAKSAAEVMADVKKYRSQSKDETKRTTLEAKDEEELLQKLVNIDWNEIADSKSGDRFDFTV
ncbi:MAG: hypothetical protein KBT19_03175 [Lachnospiraceae bacterium]|nr:hypothetical protein [Candidatus Colinaster equi]